MAKPGQRSTCSHFVIMVLQLLMTKIIIMMLNIPEFCLRLYSSAKSASASGSNLAVTWRDMSPPLSPLDCNWSRSTCTSQYSVWLDAPSFPPLQGGACTCTYGSHCEKLCMCFHVEMNFADATLALMRVAAYITSRMPPS